MSMNWVQLLASSPSLLEKQRKQEEWVEKRADILRPQFQSWCRLCVGPFFNGLTQTLQFKSSSPPSADLSDANGGGIRDCRRISAQNSVWRRCSGSEDGRCEGQEKASSVNLDVGFAHPPVHRVFLQRTTRRSLIWQAVGRSWWRWQRWWLHNLISSPSMNNTGYYQGKRWWDWRRCWLARVVEGHGQEVKVERQLHPELFKNLHIFHSRRKTLLVIRLWGWHGGCGAAESFPSRCKSLFIPHI